MMDAGMHGCRQASQSTAAACLDCVIDPSIHPQHTHAQGGGLAGGRAAQHSSIGAALPTDDGAATVGGGAPEEEEGRVEAAAA